jgi:hypothetical protein
MEGTPIADELEAHITVIFQSLSSRPAKSSARI